MKKNNTFMMMKCRHYTLSLTAIFLLITQFIFSQDELRFCGADELRINTLLKKNAGIAHAVLIREASLENFTKQYVDDFYNKKTPPSTYIIPVVFHIIHKWGNENISDAQIHDGIDILNKTFRKQLADTASIVAAFKPLHADCEIEFRLAQKDPDGNCTSGINRIASALTNTGDHSVKSIIQWPPQKYLNIYVVYNAAGLAGHAIWPSDADTIPAWDGIVIGYNYVGSIGQSTYQRSVVLAHEAGHYLNLHHIWGGNNVPGFYYYPVADPLKDCGIDDLVGDTPPTIGWQSCNLTAASCGNTVDNVQNAMDYSYCNRMFTYGQKARMQACLNATIAGRNNLWQTSNLISTGVSDSTEILCNADFTSNIRVLCEGATSPVVFTNTSFNGTFDSLSWEFPGGNPATSTAVNPSVSYSAAGTFEVSLKVYTSTDSAEVTKAGFISVLSTSPSAQPYSEGFESYDSISSPGWTANNFDTINSWQVTNAASYNGIKSVMLSNINNGLNGTKDELISKMFDLSGSSGLYISFSYAYAKKDSSGKDQLQLFILNNCNNNWAQRLNLTGAPLETAPMQSTPFVPASISEWKDTSVSIPSGWLTSSFRLKFVHTSFGGNNIYLDNIRIGGLVGIADFKSIVPSFEIAPNPSPGEFLLKFSNQGEEFFQFSIIDVLGQGIYISEKEFFPEGEYSLPFNFRNISTGMYFLKMENSYQSLRKPLLIVSE